MFKPVLAATLFTLAACATASSPENEAKRLEREAELTFANDVRRGEEVDKICFTSTIRGFSNNTERAVVLRNGRQDYLVTTRSRCNDLEDAFSLGIRSSLSCIRRGSRLIGKDTLFARNFDGRPSISCLVDKIYEWDSKAGREATEVDAETPVDPSPAP